MTTSLLRRCATAGIVLILLSSATLLVYRPMLGNDAQDSRSPLLVEARGIGRAWRFSYSGADGILGTTDDLVSEDLLKLPHGADVIVQLRSNDYIYVFACPDLDLKEIAVPDLEFSLGFHVDDYGEHDLAMDAMCGFRLPPGKTMGTLSVVPEREFHQWMGALD